MPTTTVSTADAAAPADDPDPPSVTHSTADSLSFKPSAVVLQSQSQLQSEQSGGCVIQAQHPQHFVQAVALFQRFAHSHPQAAAHPDIVVPDASDTSLPNATALANATAAAADTLYHHYGTSEHAAIFLAFVGTEVNAEPVGCCVISSHLETIYQQACELHHLYVCPTHRGAGVGRQLCEAAIEFASLTPYHCILLDTLNNREAARSFYAELGFYEIPPFQHYDNRAVSADGHFLKLDLDS